MWVVALLLRALLGCSAVAARLPDLCVMSAETPPVFPPGSLTPLTHFILLLLLS